MRRSAVLVLGAALWAASPGADGQEALLYLGNLDMPVQGDSLGSSDSVTVDAMTGEVFVCDARNNRIVIFDGEGAFRHQILGGDVYSAPLDLAVDADGLLFVAANHERRPAVLELDFDGLFRREVVLSGTPEGIEPRVTSLALSPDGRRLYLLDATNLRLWIASRDGVVEGSIDLASGLDERERRDRFLGKVDVYGDRVLVAVPTAGEIWMYHLDGRERGRVGVKGTSKCQLGFPVAAALDREGEAVALDQQRMMVMRWTPTGNQCLAQYGSIGLAPGLFYFPHDLALDATGRLYVSQGHEGRVQVYEGLPPAALGP